MFCVLCVFMRIAPRCFSAAQGITAPLEFFDPPPRRPSVYRGFSDRCGPVTTRVSGHGRETRSTTSPPRRRKPSNHAGFLALFLTLTACEYLPIDLDLHHTQTSECYQQPRGTHCTTGSPELPGLCTGYGACWHDADGEYDWCRIDPCDAGTADAGDL